MYQFWIVEGWLFIYIMMMVFFIIMGMWILQENNLSKQDRRITAVAILMSPVWPLFLAFTCLRILWVCISSVFRIAKFLFRVATDKE